MPKFYHPYRLQKLLLAQVTLHMQIDKQKLYSCIYKLVPQLGSSFYCCTHSRGLDPQLMIEATHIVQSPVTPSGNLTDQVGDLEQPNSYMCNNRSTLIGTNHLKPEYLSTKFTAILYPFQRNKQIHN